MNHFLSSLNDGKLGKSQINYFVKNYTVANLKTKEDTKTKINNGLTENKSWKASQDRPQIIYISSLQTNYLLGRRVFMVGLK